MNMGQWQFWVVQGMACTFGFVGAQLAYWLVR